MSSSNSPTKAAGIVATTKYQNIFPFVVFFFVFISLMAPINRFHQSLKKNTNTAIIVPKWSATSKASDDSSQPNKYGNNIKCADDDIGKNSAIPWIIPNIIALNTVKIIHLLIIFF